MQADSVQAIPPLALQRVHNIDPPAAGKIGRCGRLVEGDRLRARCAVTKLNTQVAAIRAKRFGPHHLHLFTQEQRLAIANPEGGEQLEFVVQAWLEVRERGRCLDGDRA